MSHILATWAANDVITTFAVCAIVLTQCTIQIINAARGRSGVDPGLANKAADQVPQETANQMFDMMKQMQATIGQVGLLRGVSGSPIAGAARQPAAQAPAVQQVPVVQPQATQTRPGSQ